MATLPTLANRDFALLRREMDRLFDGTMADGDQTETVWSPRADVAETDSGYRLSLDLPGIDRDTLDVTLDDGTLKISGERHHRSEQTEGRMHRVERAHGRFFRSFALGNDVDPEAIEAHYDDGVLTVGIGKSAAKQPRRISVGSKASSQGGGSAEDATVTSETTDDA